LCQDLVDTTRHLRAILRDRRALTFSDAERWAIGDRRRLTQEPDANRRSNMQMFELHDRQTQSPNKISGTPPWAVLVEKNLGVLRANILVDFRERCSYAAPSVGECRHWRTGDPADNHICGGR
jgi:hypothetical protein